METINMRTARWAALVVVNMGLAAGICLGYFFIEPRNQPELIAVRDSLATCQGQRIADQIRWEILPTTSVVQKRDHGDFMELTAWPSGEKIYLKYYDVVGADRAMTGEEFKGATSVWIRSGGGLLGGDMKERRLVKESPKRVMAIIDSLRWWE